MPRFFASTRQRRSICSSGRSVQMLSAERTVSVFSPTSTSSSPSGISVSSLRNGIGRAERLITVWHRVRYSPRKTSSASNENRYSSAASSSAFPRLRRRRYATPNAAKNKRISHVIPPPHSVGTGTLDSRTPISASEDCDRRTLLCDCSISRCASTGTASCLTSSGST